MARPRKPTALHALSGAMEHNPARFADRADEPKDDRPLGPPPEFLRPDQRAAWMEIERLAPWVTMADRVAVEIAASLLAAFRAIGVGQMPPHLLTRLETMLGRLGLTPSDRSKVRVPNTGTPTTNKFASNGKRP